MTEATNANSDWRSYPVVLVDPHRHQLQVMPEAREQGPRQIEPSTRRRSRRSYLLSALGTILLLCFAILRRIILPEVLRERREADDIEMRQKFQEIKINSRYRYQSIDSYRPVTLINPFVRPSTESRNLKEIPVTSDVTEATSSWDNNYSSINQCRVVQCGERKGNFARNLYKSEMSFFTREFPYYVAFHEEKSISDRIWCSGTLLNDRWVLTSANCVNVNNILTTRVSVAIRTKSEIGSNSQSIRDAWRHPLFNSGKEEYNVALVKLYTPLKNRTNFISPICLPFEDLDEPSEMFATEAGFVPQFEYRKRTEKFQVSILRINQRRCANSETFFCASDIFKQTTLPSCQVGQALVIKNENGSYVLKGIASWPGCVKRDGTRIYTKVSHLMEWICETMVTNGL